MVSYMIGVVTLPSCGFLLGFSLCSVAASLSATASAATTTAFAPCALFTNEAFSHKVGGFLNFLIFFNVMNFIFLCIIIFIF